MTESEVTPNKWKKLAISTAGGAIVGFLGAMLALNLVDRGIFGAISEIGAIAILVAMLYVFMAVFVGAGVLFPGFGAKFLNVEDAGELDEMRGSLIASGIGMGALGLILALLALAGDGGVVGGEVAAISCAVLLVIAVYYSVRSSQQSDELMREVGRDTATLSYYFLALIIGLWAAGAHLGMLPALKPLAILVIIWSVVLLAVFIAAGRKGMLAPR